MEDVLNWPIWEMLFTFEGGVLVLLFVVANAIERGTEKIVDNLDYLTLVVEEMRDNTDTRPSRDWMEELSDNLRKGE